MGYITFLYGLIIESFVHLCAIVGIGTNTHATLNHQPDPSSVKKVNNIHECVEKNYNVSKYVTVVRCCFDILTEYRVYTQMETRCVSVCECVSARACMHAWVRACVRMCIIRI